MSFRVTSDIDRDVGARLSILRKAKGLSQTALGAAVGVTFQQIQKYEKGMNRIGSSRLQQLADTLEVPVSELFGEHEPQEQSEIFGFLAEPGAMEVLRSYALIKDDQHKRAVLSIVRTIARISAKPIE